MSLADFYASLERAAGASAWILRSRYYAPVAATQKAPVRKEAKSMCGNDCGAN